METIKPIEIPPSHVAFANAVADLAEQNGIREFDLTYRPEWERVGGEEWDQRVNGKATIHFSAKDGRGRPCRNLGIQFDATIIHPIETTSPSTD